jgi:hypothetical protein
MKKFAINVALVALLVGVAGFSTPLRAETGQVAVVFTKGGLTAYRAPRDAISGRPLMRC